MDLDDFAASSAGVDDLDDFAASAGEPCEGTEQRQLELPAVDEPEHPAKRGRGLRREPSAASVGSLRSVGSSFEAGSVSLQLLPYRARPYALRAGHPRGYRDRFAGVCQACFEAGSECSHFEERPLAALLIGHNPSDDSWEKGFPYANRTNMFWRLLTAGGVVVRERERGNMFVDVVAKMRRTDEASDAAATAPSAGGAPAADGKGEGDGDDDNGGPEPLERLVNRMAESFSVGHADLGCVPGNDANAFGSDEMLLWRADLYRRLRLHAKRADGEPKIVAFTGKRQYSYLFEPPLSSVASGEQLGGDRALPPGFPFRSASIFVLPSSSGRAVYSHEDRVRPYVELGLAVREIRDGAPRKLLMKR